MVALLLPPEDAGSELVLILVAGLVQLTVKVKPATNKAIYVNSDRGFMAFFLSIFLMLSLI